MVRAHTETYAPNDVQKKDLISALIVNARRKRVPHCEAMFEKSTMRHSMIHHRVAVSFEVAAFALIAIIIFAAAVSMAYRSMEIAPTQTTFSSGSEAQSANVTVPVAEMNQTPTTREVWIQWQYSSTGQDRFSQNLIIVNQGDTVKLTFFNNDSVIHNFVLGAPYNINVNASVPGLVNDLTGQKVTGPATSNSPGVVVTGRPGSVTARYTFIARYAGIYEYVCTYHVEIGMFGYFIVLPNAAYHAVAAANTTATTPTSPSTSLVTILPGAAYPNSTGFSPPTITVVIGVNNTVEWVNNDTAPHTVTATDRSFDSGNMNPADTWTYTFTQSGTYTYTCSYHPWMKGTVIVLAG